MTHIGRPVSLVITTAMIAFWSCDAKAEKAPLSEKQLQDTATHIVVGKVQAVYSRLERKGDYEFVRSVAEVKLDRIEKGQGLSDLLYIRFFAIHWKGTGQLPPGPSGHHPRPEVGFTYRFYLARNAYDGFSKNNHDGGYNVIYGNGVQAIEK